MIIKNFKQIATTANKKLALSIVERGISGALPNSSLEKIVHKNFLQVERKKISLEGYGHIYTIAIGKSADLMTSVVDSLTRVHGGMIVMPDTEISVIRKKKFAVVRSSHPVPTVKSIFAAKKITEFLKLLEATDFVIFLISGGASSLVSQPDGISLKDKQLVTSLLLRSGANIREINCVRKHLSKVKGGRLVGSLGCNAVSLVMSDVVGDDLSVIASGITYCDKSTFCDAKKVLIKYNLKNLAPTSVWTRIILGTKGIIPETPKKPTIQNYIIHTNRNCVDLMKTRAQKLGFVTKAIYSLEGNVDDAASEILKHVPNSQNFCLVFGGETAVTVKGKGKGGRNQELVLNLLKKLRDREQKITVVSVGTDGIDGNTTAAGAIADSSMPLGHICKYLNGNDSYHYFKKYGGLVFTGSTHTNLMDVGLVLLK
ncbi:MAG: glycerate kinase type-2 family protein [Nitrosotalea sp.]